MNITLNQKHHLSAHEITLLKAFGFSSRYPDKEDVSYVQYIKYIEHPLLKESYILVDGEIQVWCRSREFEFDYVCIVWEPLTEMNLITIIDFMKF